MRPLRYSINVTLDGCVDHTAFQPDEELHVFHAGNVARSDALLLGRTTYQMMEAGWRGDDPRPEWTEPFARAIGSVKKYVVSSTLKSVDWNAELIRGDLAESVRKLKAQPGQGIGTGGVTLPTALAKLGLIDEYEFVVYPTIAGHGPTLLAGLPAQLDLREVGRREFKSGAVAMRFVPGKHS